MQRITLKDNRFRIIGYVDIAPNGDKTLRNEKFQILGYYKINSSTFLPFVGKYY